MRFTLRSTRSTWLPALYALVMLVSGGRPASAQATCPSPYTPTKSGGNIAIEVDWEKLQACIGAQATINGRIDLRIDEDAAVDVRVINFNFVAYTVSYKVEETVVESYVALEKLWAQLLGLPLFGGATLAVPMSAMSRKAVQDDACSSFEACLANVALLVTTTNIELDRMRSAHRTSVALNATQRDTVKMNSVALGKFDEAIDEALKRLLETQKPTTLQQVTDFDTVYGRVQALSEKIAAYQSAAVRVETGQVYHIGKKKAGTIIAVELTPKDSTQAARTPVADLEYFVHSRIPLTFHIGYSYSNLHDVDFEKVRSVAQGDLFTMVKDNDSTSAMVAFLSLGRTFGSSGFGLHGTLGTDFADPGNRIYVGGSVQLFKRLFVTAGKMSAAQEVGENKVIDRAGELLEARELFATIRSHRDWKSNFFAVSFRVF